MISKVRPIHYLILIVGLWYIYFRFNDTFSLIYTITITIVSLVLSVRYFYLRQWSYIENPSILEHVRIFFTILALLSSIYSLNMNFDLGGVPIHNSDISGSLEVGKYYMANHGTYTSVPYEHWFISKLMSNTTTLMIYSAFLWNVIYIARTSKFHVFENFGNFSIKDWTVSIIACLWFIGFTYAAVIHGILDSIPLFIN